MNAIRPCPDLGPTCCEPRCTNPPTHAGFTGAKVLVEHHRCPEHSGELERVRQWDPRWKAIAG